MSQRLRRTRTLASVSRSDVYSREASLRRWPCQTRRLTSALMGACETNVSAWRRGRPKAKSSFTVEDWTLSPREKGVVDPVLRASFRSSESKVWRGWRPYASPAVWGDPGASGTHFPHYQRMWDGSIREGGLSGRDAVVGAMVRAWFAAGPRKASFGWWSVNRRRWVMRSRPWPVTGYEVRR